MMEIRENQPLEGVPEGGSKGQDYSWKKGETLTFVRVRFPGNTKSFPFLVGKRRFSYGQKVVAISDRGMDIGHINSFPYQAPFDESMLPIRSITRVAEKEDLKQQQESVQKIRDAQTLCEDLIGEFKLDMYITHVENIQFGKKVVFYFHAPERVDFRQLVKTLVSRLKLRVELRQISLRDRTAAIGSIGPCGLMTCCSSFLKNYGRVNIKMAKNQNLALIPGKLNGVCGQLKCCVGYEEEVYREKRKELPALNDLIQTANGDKGKVSRLHLMPEEFEMLTDQGRVRRYAKSQYQTQQQTHRQTFPKKFEHIIIENKHVIGRDLSTSEKEDFVVDNSAFSLSDSSSQEEDEKEKLGTKNREESFEEEEGEESEEDRLALKKAQSLSLEEQERESQNNSNYASTPRSNNMRGGNRSKHGGGGRNFKHFSKGKGGRYNRFNRNKSRKK